MTSRAPAPGLTWSWYYNQQSSSTGTSSAKFPDLGVRSPDFLIKNWPLTILPIFPTYSRLVWQSFFHTKNHRKTSPTGHQRPPFGTPFGLSSFSALLWPAVVSILPILIHSEWDYHSFFLPKLALLRDPSEADVIAADDGCILLVCLFLWRQQLLLSWKM